eukprot:TRINITY_DN4468_c0_g2_i6.p1 TRINITY_DN4468_c0_g2~~TRINITY_DN4468_c0_g2_i6.p1  ORF type:complete len:587 (-),score=193.84 TRINITY_DN4468_c0_g2_i6:101-1861(-)
MGDSLTALTYMLSTDTQPGEMYPGYTLAQGWALFFDSYNVLMLWVLLPIAMGVVYNEWRYIVTDNIAADMAHTYRMGSAACSILGVGHDVRVDCAVHFSTFHPLLARILKYPALPETQAMQVYRQLNETKTKHLSGTGLLQVARLKLKPPTEPPAWPVAAAVLEGAPWAAAIDLFVLSEAGLIIFLASTANSSPAAHVNRVLFITVFFAELVAKVCALGPGVYMKHRKGWIHIEGGLCCAALLAFFGFWAIDSQLVFYEALDVVAMVFLVRVAQVCYRVKQFRVLLYSMAFVANDLLELLTVLAAVLWMFAALGIKLFGGKIFSAAAGFGGSAAALLLESEGSIYLAINYNSMSTSLNALIMLMVLLVCCAARALYTAQVGNDWETYVATAAHVTDLGRAKAFYFVAYSTLSFVFLNVIVAFFVDSYGAAMASKYDKKLDRISPEVQCMLAQGYGHYAQQSELQILRESAGDFRALQPEAKLQHIAADVVLSTELEIAKRRDGVVMGFVYRNLRHRLGLSIAKRCFWSWRSRTYGHAISEMKLRQHAVKSLSVVLRRVRADRVKWMLRVWAEQLLKHTCSMVVRDE